MRIVNVECTTVHRLQQTENNAQNAALLLSANTHARTCIRTRIHTHTLTHAHTAGNNKSTKFIVVAADEQQIIQTIQTDTHTHTRSHSGSAAAEQRQLRATKCKETETQSRNDEPDDDDRATKVSFTVVPVAK